MAFGMHVIAFDKFVSAERFRELGVEGVETSDELYERADVITIHLPEDPGDRELDRRRGDREDEGRRADRELRPRGAGRPRRAARRGSSRARWPAPRSTSSRRSRSPTHPLFGRPDVVVTPAPRRLHGRGPGPGRRLVTAEQVVAALHRRRGHQRGQHPGGPAGGDGGAGAVRAAVREARPPRRRASATARSTGSRPSSAAGSPSTTPACSAIAVLVGILSGHTEEPVNLVNAPAMAEERGIELIEIKDASSRGLHRPGHGADRVRRGRASRSPAPASARATRPTWSRVWGESFYLPFADHICGLPLHRPAGDDRAGGHRLRRGGRQHRLGGGRAPRRTATRR